MDAESQHVANLQAEIEEMESVINEQAEHIRRLIKVREVQLTRTQAEAYEETIRILTAQITRRNQLITELCACLEEEFGTLDQGSALKDKHPWNLIKRAKEATR